MHIFVFIFQSRPPTSSPRFWFDFKFAASTRGHAHSMEWEGTFICIWVVSRLNCRDTFATGHVFIKFILKLKEKTDTRYLNKSKFKIKIKVKMDLKVNWKKDEKEREPALNNRNATVRTKKWKRGRDQRFERLDLHWGQPSLFHGDVRRLSSIFRHKIVSKWIWNNFKRVLKKKEGMVKENYF